VVAQDFKGLEVAVLGGGDNGFENALYALDHGAKAVTIYARTVRAQRQFVNRMPAEHIVLGDYEVDPQARRVNGRAYDLLMVFFGWAPGVKFASGLARPDAERGYIPTDVDTAGTSGGGVYGGGHGAQRLQP